MRRAVVAGVFAALGVVGPAAWAPPGVVAGGAAAQAADRAALPDALAAAEDALWNRLRERGRPDEIDAFLVLFPQSRFAAEARRRRDDLAAAAPPGRPAEEARPEQQTQQPRPEAVPPGTLAAAAAAAAVAPDCGLLAAASDETSLTVAGALRRGQEAMVQGMLDAFGVPAEAARLRLEPFDGPYCEALSAVLLNTVTPRPDAPPRVALLGDRPLLDGEQLRFRVEMPDWPAHLGVFYLAVSGEAATLVSDAQPRPAGAVLTLDNPRWKIAAPFGTDLLLVVASELPLFEQRRRSGVEKLEEFTPALAAALGRLRRAAARAAVRAVAVETAAAR